MRLKITLGNEIREMYEKASRACLNAVYGLSAMRPIEPIEDSLDCQAAVFVDEFAKDIPRNAVVIYDQRGEEI